MGGASAVPADTNLTYSLTIAVRQYPSYDADAIATNRARKNIPKSLRDLGDDTSYNDRPASLNLPPIRGDMRYEE